jgi:hypothetical protein
MEKEQFYRELNASAACRGIGRKVLLTIMTRQFFPGLDVDNQVSEYSRRRAGCRIEMMMISSAGSSTV